MPNSEKQRLKLTYCIIQQDTANGPKYFGLAWDDNYRLTTSYHDSYADARCALVKISDKEGGDLSFFDGEYCWDHIKMSEL